MLCHAKSIVTLFASEPLVKLNIMIFARGGTVRKFLHFCCPLCYFSVYLQLRLWPGFNSCVHGLRATPVIGSFSPPQSRLELPEGQKCNFAQRPIYSLDGWLVQWQDSLSSHNFRREILTLPVLNKRVKPQYGAGVYKNAAKCGTFQSSRTKG